MLPILKAHCHECHGANLRESNYRLDVKAAALGSGDSGAPAIRPGQSADSRLIQYVSGTDPDGIVMPPQDEGQPLSEQQIAILRRWIDQGADWPEDPPNVSDIRLTTDHWSFQPLRQDAPPQLDHPWVRTPIDGFVLQRLQPEGLAPSPEADRRRWVRRLYLDMLGLPPTPGEVREFVENPAPDAYEQLVDRVLASPHYGERWARHWLDVVRFGESDGFETNPERPRAYPYRDYVIAALNDDKPYDQFVLEQIAGDMLGADVATGFLVAGPYDRVKSPDINLTLMQRQDELADIVNTTGTAFLGLTVGCARCHNHKFDPILQGDYYSLQAVFAGVQHGERQLNTPATALIHRQVQELTGRIDAGRQQLAQMESLASAVDSADRPGLRPLLTPNTTKRCEPRSKIGSNRSSNCRRRCRLPTWGPSRTRARPTGCTAAIRWHRVKRWHPMRCRSSDPWD